MTSIVSGLYIFICVNIGQLPTEKWMILFLQWKFIRLVWLRSDLWQRTVYYFSHQLRESFSSTSMSREWEKINFCHSSGIWNSNTYGVYRETLLGCILFEAGVKLNKNRIQIFPSLCGLSPETSPCSLAVLHCGALACFFLTTAWPSPYCCWSRCP